MSFKAMKVWRAVQKHPGLGCAELSKLTGMDSDFLSNTLNRLRRKGCAKSVGTSRGCVFQAKWYVTEVAPFDGRGGARGSRKALADGKLPWPEALKMANKARIKRKLKRPPTPVFSTELERCWRRAVVLPQVGQAGE